MEKLTDLFGKNLERLVIFYEDLQPIVGNPAFLRMVQTKEEGIIKVGEYQGDDCSLSVNIPDAYDAHVSTSRIQNTRLQLLLHGQPALIVGTDSIVMCEQIGHNGSYQMVQLKSDRHGYLFAKFMKVNENKVTIENIIFDKAGVELQKDTISDDISKTMKRVLESAYKYPAECANSIRVFLTSYLFECIPGSKAHYTKSSHAKYIGYRRDLGNFEFCSIVTEWGTEFKSRLDLTCSPAVMKPLNERELFSVYPGDLAKSIALEENEDTRNALIAYCASRGITSKMVARLREETALIKD